MPPPTRENAAPCGECLLPARDPSAAGAAESPGMSSTMKKSAGGGGVGDSHKSEISLLSFPGSKLSCHLCHVDAERVKAIEGLLALLYDRVDVRFSRTDLAIIFIAMGRDAV